MIGISLAASRRYWARRIGRQAAIIALGVIASGALVVAATERESLAFRVSLGTGYVSLALLAASLAIGPIRIAAGLRSPPSMDLRRDVGVCASLFAVAHVITGLQVHMRGAMWKYFLDPNRGPVTVVPRLDAFGLANYTGIAATALLLALVAISNDFAVRRMGVARWKRVQRWSYAAAAFVVIHSVVYQLLDRRTTPFVVAFVAIVLLTLLVQITGVRHARRSRSVGPNPVPPMDG